METKFKALCERVTEIEMRLNIQTRDCDGYCYQPTTDPGGMCQPCRKREQIKFQKMNLKGSP